jgi:DNA ligase-associated metallophosphoesterase
VIEIELKGQTFVLLPQKAIFWKEQKTLLISDLHLGKVTHFRKEGIAVPSVALEDNFTRLDALLKYAETRRIIFLGDLFHHHYNREWERFGAWRSYNSNIEMSNVQGNHDILPEHHFKKNNIAVHKKEFIDGQFLFIHHPQENIPDGLHVFCGHIHPVFKLYSRGRQSVTLPCFVADAHQTILPSFGVFTGGSTIQMIDDRKIFGIVGEKIIAMHLNEKSVNQ